MKKYQCIVCGWIYDESEGLPQDGIAPGQNGMTFLMTGLAQIGVSKADFEMIEI
jgi:rubredoxin